MCLLFDIHVVPSHYDLLQTDSGGHSFVGSAPAAKEFDCVIIFDPQTMVRALYSPVQHLILRSLYQTFTMEKVDSSVQLSYDRKTSHGPRSAASRAYASLGFYTILTPCAAMPVSSASSSRPSTSSSSGQPLANRTKQFRQPVEDIGADEDAEGEIDDEFLGLLAPTTKPLTAVPKQKDASNGKGKKVDSSNRSNKQAASTWPLRQDDDSEPEEALSKQIRPPPPAPAPAPAPTPTPATAPKAKAAGGAKAARGTTSAAMKKAKKAAQASSVFRSFPKPTLPPAPAAAPAAAAAPPSATPSSATLPASRSAPSTVNAAKQASSKREREGEVGPASEVVAPAATSQPRQKRQKVNAKVAQTKVEKPKEPVALALPGTEFNLPGSVSAPAITPSSAAQSSNVAAPATGPPDDSEEEDWDEVEPSANEPSANEPASSASHPPPMRSIHMEVVIPESNPRPEHQEPVDGSDGMAAGDDDFLMDMFDDEPAEDEAQPEDDDFLESAFEESQPSNPPPPVSMNDLAKEELGGLWGGEEDEESSDDSESDDE